MNETAKITKRMGRKRWLWLNVSVAKIAKGRASKQMPTRTAYFSSVQPFCALLMSHYMIVDIGWKLKKVFRKTLPKSA